MGGPYLAACLLLVFAGAWKALRPEPAAEALGRVGLPALPVLARLLGAGELALGAAAAITWSPWAAGAVGLAYLSFAGFALVARSRPGTAGCGCFGARSTPLSAVHGGLDLALAGTAAAVALSPGAAPLGSPLEWASALLLAWLLYLAMTELPRTLVLVRRS